MTEATKTAEAPAAKESKPLTVIDDMAQRRVFDSAEEATAYIGKCQTEYTDFAAYPVAFAGVTEDGDFDPEVYNDDMRIAVSVLTKRGEGSNSTSVHCIVIWPAPKLEAILGIPEGVELSNIPGIDWARAILDKELNHVAVRQLRRAEDAEGIYEAVASMPLTIADYVTSGRESSAGILESFNTLWQLIKKAIGTRYKGFALANLSKKELRKAMESSSYAATVYPQLETRLDKQGNPDSLFVKAAQFGQVLCKAESLDATIFDRMLANRDERQIEVAADEEDFDFEAMAKSIMAKKADAPAAAETEGDTADDSTAQGDPEAAAE